MIPNPPGAPANNAPAAPLREAHAHLAWHGRALAMLRLGDCASREDCLARIAGEAARMAASGRRDWLMALQLRVEAWPDPRWPTREELDHAVSDRPAWLMSFDHHSLAANSAALRAAGFSETSPDPEGGVLVRDRSGRLTGLCLEAAARRVREAAPEPPVAELRQHVRAALADLARHGFTEVHDLLTQPWLPPLLAELHDAGELPVRIGLFPLVEHLPPLAASRRAWERPGLALLGGKIFVDGTLNARTAWSLTDYAHGLTDHPRGTPLMTAPAIAAALRTCRDLGLGLAAHAIGDAAVRACLDAAASLPTSRPTSLPIAAGNQTFRIEHAELIDEADIPRFCALGLTASVQPCHLLYDIEALERFLPHRLHRVLPLRDLLQSGLVPGQTLIFGSDTPIVRPDPQDSITAATRRARTTTSPGGPPTAPLAPDQAIDEPTARRCFTGG